MKKTVCLLALVLAFALLSAAGGSQVESITLNNCGTLRGNIHLVIDVEPTGPGDQASNSCQTSGEDVRLTFYVPR